MPSDNASLQQLDLLVNKRNTYFAQIQATYDLIKKISDPSEKSAFVARCQIIDTIYAKFATVQDSIEKVNPRVESSDRIEVITVTLSCDELYYKIKGTHSTILEQQASKSDNPSTSSAAAKLPKLNVPVFDGCLENWPNFISLYNSVIHNSSGSDLMKFTYLRSLLKGPPLSLIENITLSDANYKTAYQAILDRYQCKRILAAHHLNKMMNFIPLVKDNTKELQSFLDVFHSNMEAFKNLSLPNPHDFVIFHWALRCLTPNMRNEFEQTLASDTVPTFNQLIKFIQSQCRIKELMQQDKSDVRNSNSTKPKTVKSFMATSSEKECKLSVVKNNDLCPVCKLAHKIYACPVFKKFGLDKKYETLKDLKRCFSCLGAHMRPACSSKNSCAICKTSKHHTLLHNESSSLSPQISAVSSSPVAEAPSQPVLTTTYRRPQPKNCSVVLLATAQALIRNIKGRFEPIRLIIDSGSQINCITADCVKRLGLRVQPLPVNISGITENTVSRSKGIVSCILSPKNKRESVSTVEAVVLNKICSDLPTAQIDSEIRHKFAKLNLADSRFFEKGKIDLLLGAGIFSKIWQPGSIISTGDLTCVETIFGWVILGEVSSTLELQPNPVSLLSTVTSLDESIQRFWKQEEVKVHVPDNPDDVLCEEHFSRTHTRDESGSFVVRLPFRDNAAHSCFGDSKDSARRRWLRLEKNLYKNENLRISYQSFLTEYLTLNHMQPAEEDGNYYLPHFAVIRESSSTTKVRVVFDASCQDSTGISLNDRLLGGPKLQKDISEVISLFRLNPVALSADIKMMYRMIWIHPDDRKFQHIFWRSSADIDVTEYSLNTLTFGINAAPFIAQRCLRQLAEENEKEFPLAAEAVRTNCYMDDFVISVDSAKRAIELKNELISLLALANFSLRKWISNFDSVLEDIPEELQAHSLVLSETEHRVLGLQWNPKQDTFSYQLNLNGEAKTKRAILSQIASLFDPLGWISPVVFYAKCFMQKLWLSGCSWDEDIPETLLRWWAEYASQLPCLSSVNVPRYALFSGHKSRCLIGFCDGSELGYSAVLYLRCASENQDEVTVNILKSKTKVAPLKSQSIPRLELNGALLLSQLYESMNFVLEKLDISRIYLFTDSTVVLSWLQISPHLLKTYVANRVVAILDNTSPHFWNYVPSHLNAADCASRGLLPEKLLNHSLWWAGPPFLKQPTDEWPLQRVRKISTSEIPDCKSDSSVLLLVSPKSEEMSSDKELISVISTFSSLTRLKRVFAWIYRFSQRIRNLTNTADKFLRVSEIRAGLEIIIRATQSYYFAEDIRLMKKERLCSKTLRSLSPFFDEKMILRVGGRLRHSNLAPDAKHPVLIPKQSHLAVLICDFYHLQSLHGGPQVAQALIQRRFWIPSIRSLLRKRIFRCIRCYKMKCQPNFPVMADLPPARFSTQRVFKTTGVDMAGPLPIKEHTRRNARISKGYFCIFVCMSTKAVHLELTSDLSTPSYQAALERFVARRGLCSDIYCDNGTNFVGAANEAKEIISFLKNSQPDITDFLSKKEIQYHFNPPKSPWFGGLWEAGVKSVKTHLLRSVGHHPLTSEEMTTLLARIEAVLNSRPLVAVSNDVHDKFDYLTPGHFLIGTSLLSPPEQNLLELPDNRLSRWQFVRKSLQHFWKRWSTEYLHTLTQRKKWTTPHPGISEGDVVYVMRETSSPLDWPIGRIEKVLPGRDNIIRVAQVRTSKGVYIRPVAKLALLPVQ